MLLHFKNLSVFDSNEYYFVFIGLLQYCLSVLDSHINSDMLLDIAQHVLHVVSVEIMIVLRVVVSAAPVPVACCRELHVHNRRLV